MTEQEPFEIVVAHLDGYVRVKLRGDLDHQATVEHDEALREVTDLRDRVVLDLAELRFIDSSGIAFLVTVAHAHDGPVRLEHAPSQVRRVLAVTGLTEVFDFGSD
jgi:anti-sigma B factor antagonist